MSVAPAPIDLEAVPGSNSIGVPPLPVRRFTVEEYRRMGQGGVFADDERVELLEGWIVPKMTKYPPHESTLDRADEQIRALLPAEWRLRVQMVVTTGDSEPEPDLTIALNPSGRYNDRHPNAQDVAVLVEVSDSSLAKDRGIKRRLYARAGFPVYWIINLVDSQVEVYTEPTGPVPDPTYRTRRDFRDGDEVPLVIGGQEVGRIAVRTLLP